MKELVKIAGKLGLAKNCAGKKPSDTVSCKTKHISRDIAPRLAGALTRRRFQVRMPSKVSGAYHEL